MSEDFEVIGTRPEGGLFWEMADSKDAGIAMAHVAKLPSFEVRNMVIDAQVYVEYPPTKWH